MKTMAFLGHTIKEVDLQYEDFKEQHSNCIFDDLVYKIAGEKYVGVVTYCEKPLEVHED